VLGLVSVITQDHNVLPTLAASYRHEGETFVIRNANIKFKDGRPRLDPGWGRKVFSSQ
jgi:hypothetical protein